MTNPTKPILSFLSLLCLAAPQARSQIDHQSTVTGSGAVHTTDGTHLVRATLGQPAVSYRLAGPVDAALGFWHNVPPAKRSASFAEEPTTGSDAIALHARPNPFSGSTQITLQLERAEPVSLLLYDLLGQPVRTLIDAEQRDGTFTVDLIADDLPPGSYTLTVIAGDERQTLPLLLVR